MPKKVPGNSDELTRLMEAAMPARKDGEEIDEEHLTLLCEGNIDFIPSEKRAVLIDQISADPATADLILQLRNQGWGAEKKLNDPMIFALRASSWAWATAACLIIVLGTLRVVSSPNQSANPSQQTVAITPNNAPPSVENPSNAGNRLPAPAPVPAPASKTPSVIAENTTWNLREIALFISIIAILVLSLPALIWIKFRKLRNRVH